MQVQQPKEIVEPALSIIDAHHHLFDRPNRRYLLDEFRSDATSGHDVIASVYVETRAMVRVTGPEALRPIGEIEFANGEAARSAADQSGVQACAGIVGFADLTLGRSVAPLLDRALESAPERFKGVRQVTIDHHTETPFALMTTRPVSGILDHPRFAEGFSQLAPRGLSFDAAVFHHQMPRLARLADAFPDTTIILNHIGHAVAMAEDGESPQSVFPSWKANLRALSSRQNVICKISGLGMALWGFPHRAEDSPHHGALAATWRPYVETAIEAFGVERCMMASNYPMDSFSCDYVTLWNALKTSVSGASDDEKRQLFAETARDTYRLDVDLGGPSSR